MAPPIHEISADTQHSIESFVTDWVSDDGIPGASVALVEGSDVIYADGFGARNLESNAPATKDTLYGIGSCTKSFTTLGIMQLAAEGELDPHDPISDYVPYFDSVEGAPITIHDLMTHSSGMPSDGSAIVLISRLMGTDPIEVPLSSEQDFRRHLEGSLPERVVDDDRFFYYNSGFTVLGHVIEEIDGRSYESYVQDEILEPLGMNRSTFDTETVNADSDGLTPYYTKDGSSIEGSFPDDEVIYAPGGLLSSVTEMASYLSMQMSGGDHNGTTLIDSDQLDQMHKRYSTRQVAVDGTAQDYGYGWMISDFLGDTMIGHGGSIGVSNAFVGFLEDSNVGAVILCNTAAPTHPMHVGPAVLSLAQGTDPADSVPMFALRDKIEQVTGEYESYRGIQSASVEQQGGGLELTLSTDLRSESHYLLPESLDRDDLTFTTVAESGYNVPVEFEVTEDEAHLFIQRWHLHKHN